MDNWITEIKGQIIDKRDAENFDDIISCYQNGLLRAGFLMAWLMLIESLKRKIVELADKEVKVAASKLKNEGITLYYKDLSKYHFYTKSQQFKYEGEWRILKEAGDEELYVANYDGLVCLYKDYPFEDLGLKPAFLYLGANLAYRDVNVPLLVDLSKRELNVRNVLMSDVESLRV